ncbi:MJ0042-type zinc finger domain-containing protein [Candidatus Fonsibacter ubiquis]|uniref:MJ0042-type zinc finger domain-containing protein n=1 Tax=Candidatus Fonsibacter ubiquis TaxID=1925548 RepID=UPI000C073ADA|nr:MJ0042-type zinc finger domain-containing protein [Candidatus Fonsibacter ubiquis]
MIVECACKKYKFAVKAEEIGINGRVVQCGVCDQKWFQEPASSEEFKVLKEIHIKEEEEKKEKAKNQKPIKEKSGKNYVPIKYENKSKINYTKIFLTILIISTIGITISFENREYILSKNPELADFFSLLEEFVEYLKQYYLDIIEAFTPKQK